MSSPVIDQLFVGQPIRATVMFADGKMSTCACECVVDSIDRDFHGKITANLSLCGTKQFGFITQGGANERYKWNCENIAHPAESIWVKFQAGLANLFKITKDEAGLETTLELVKTILEVVTGNASWELFDYCTNRGVYNEAIGNVGASEAWEANAETLLTVCDNLECLYRYVNGYGRLTPCILSIFLGRLDQKHFPTAVTE